MSKVSKETTSKFATEFTTPYDETRILFDDSMESSEELVELNNEAVKISLVQRVGCGLKQDQGTPSP
jgi:hypothetical protein